MILNELPGIIYSPENFKKRKRSGEDCGHEWVSISKFCEMGQDQMEKSESVVPTTAILCGKNTRNYCGFNKAAPYCYICYAEHILGVSR